MALAPVFIGLGAMVLVASGAWAQVPGAAQAASSPASAAAAARAPASARPTRPASPIASVFKVEKVTVDATGKEELERATSANVGDTVQYSVTHTNRSQRRLLRVDFGIPIPHGTTYVADSADPPEPKRIEQLDPGESVTLRLRVRIDPDPTLVPTPSEPRRPELGRDAGVGLRTLVAEGLTLTRVVLTC